MNDDDNTEEGEERSRTITIPNEHTHSPPLAVSTRTLVGAKRRKSNVAYKINIEDKVKEIESFCFLHFKENIFSL